MVFSLKPPFSSSQTVSLPGRVIIVIHDEFGVSFASYLDRDSGRAKQTPER